MDYAALNLKLEEENKKGPLTSAIPPKPPLEPSAKADQPEKMVMDEQALNGK